MEFRPPRCGLMPFLFALVCGVASTVPGTAAVNEFSWTKSSTNLLQSDGYQLIGSLTATYNNVYLVYQCSFRCLQTSADKCASYNYLPAQRRCELNSASHLTSPSSLVPVSGSQYFLRTTFSIDQPQLALGPCAASPCKNQGICLTQRAQDGTLSSTCLCSSGWTGAACDVPVSQPIWNAWTDWTQCSTSCGDGMKLRTRQCTVNGNVVSSQLCYGRDMDQSNCNLQDCPGWSYYGSWSQCSSDASCGTGTQERTRTCNNGGIPGVDLMCMGPIAQSTPCNSPSCFAAVRLVNGPTYGEGRVNIYDDVNGVWLPVCASSWSQANADVVCKQLGFSEGSVHGQAGTYGNEPGATSAVTGMNCVGNENFLATCPHSSWHGASCSTGPHAGVQCIVDGRWSSWSVWSACSASCGSGVLTRTRQCNSPAPARGGQSCAGSASDTMSCTAAPCPVDAVWMAWSAWSACNASCGGGSQTRSRVCQEALYGGRTCSGSNTDAQSCNTQPCPVDGVWNDWGVWSSCNATCGSGIRQRIRTCMGPFNGGIACQGDVQQIAFCNDNPCPVDGQWSAWSRWLDCSVSCGGGTQTRYRLCDGASNGGSCAGNTQQNQNQACNTQSCPVNCTWLDWSAWSACSVTCGGGVLTRTRGTVPAQFGGLECVGDRNQTTPCNTNSCSIPGLWLAWSEWSMCSATCGTSGVRTRTRVCNMTSFGSLTSSCLPTNGVGSTDSLACNQFSCTPTAASCQELFTRGLEDTGSFVNVDPDGTGALQEFGVECQRYANGTIATLVHNLHEQDTLVQGFSDPGSFVSQVTYVDQRNASISASQIIALVDASTTCRQYVKWNCFAAAINSPTTSTGVSYKITWLTNRNGRAMTYWAGAAPTATTDTSPTVICACGQSQTCAVANTRCNCDAGDNVWRNDDGFITRKLDLPIMTFFAGDTGPITANKKGYYVVGPLICN